MVMRKKRMRPFSNLLSVTTRSLLEDASIVPASPGRYLTGIKRGPKPENSYRELVRLRQPEHALGDVAQDELAAHRRDAPDEGFAQVALDVVFARVAVAAERHHGLLAGVEARLAREVLRRVRFRAAGLAAVVERRRLERHEVRRLERHPVRRERVLDRLVLADRAVENDALLGIGGGAAHRAASQ